MESAKSETSAASPLQKLVMILFKTCASFSRKCCFRVHYPDGNITYWLEYDQVKPLYDMHGGEMEFSKERFLES